MVSDYFYSADIGLSKELDASLLDADLIPRSERESLFLNSANPPNNAILCAEPSPNLTNEGISNASEPAA